MNLGTRIAGGLAGAAVVILITLALQSSDKPGDTPPLTGWMQNFTPVEKSRPAPQAAFSDANNTPVSLADFKGRVILVNFWATWCGPCVREMPSLDRLQARLGGPDFAVIALSQDRKGWSIITPFVKKLGLDNLAIYRDIRAQTALTLKIRGLPTSILFDREGREIGRLAGHAEWDSDEAIALIEHYLRS